MDDLIQKLDFSPDSFRYYLTYVLVFVGLFNQRRFLIKHIPAKHAAGLIKAMGIIMVLMVIIPVLLAGYLFLAG
ncbi:hypothetical protein [Lautropia mirabilis]|jgi:hypothetical protein|uniref:Uncharacterized protein n=1 Tax=Lautropia mirabilis ATCC 51599 TaxID=887898 RepID=E7RWB1_9BURK|nr:hypothetical protein [Lautropia mirabilis]EFV95286.1 hypothetical protein HMPREF0551_0774 [Lautropia mirabilis ATCC 51599]VEH02556.1 Uncharacterised protein [Lautropia mirabilis]